jgi:hypothetical protein
MTDFRLKSSDAQPFDFGWRTADTPFAAIAQVAHSYGFDASPSAGVRLFCGGFDVVDELITIALTDKAREAVLHAQDRAADEVAARWRHYHNRRQDND